MPPISRRAPSDRWVMCWKHLKIRKENCNLQKSPRESGCPRHHLTVISVSGCLKNPPTSWDVSSKHGEAERKRKQKRRELRVNVALSIVYWLSTFCGCQESLIENRFTNASCALFARLPGRQRRLPRISSDQRLTSKGQGTNLGRSNDCDLQRRKVGKS